MFKEESIELYCKLFCFLVFFLVIVFLNNVYSLLLLFGYFFLASRKEESNIVVIMYTFTLLGLAFGFINSNLTLLKLFLVIDFAYYFIRYVKKNKRSSLVSKVSEEDPSEVENNEKDSNQEEIKYYDNEDSSVVESYYDSDEAIDKNEIVVNDGKINEINNELKKGNLLKEEDINLIKCHLEDKEQDDLKEQENTKYLRFANFKKSLQFDFLKNKDWKNKFSMDNYSNSFKSYKWQFKLDDINGLYVMCHLFILILAIVVE